MELILKVFTCIFEFIVDPKFHHILRQLCRIDCNTWGGGLGGGGGGGGGGGRAITVHGKKNQTSIFVYCIDILYFWGISFSLFLMVCEVYSPPEYFSWNQRVWKCLKILILSSNGPILANNYQNKS